MPFVSVVLPVRNTERYVAAAVESVLRQTWTDLDLVVVDDGSTDSSVAEVERVADCRVRIIRGPQRGVAAARRAGIEATDSAWVAFQDADDLSAPGRIQQQVVAGQMRLLTAVGCSYRAIDEDGRTIKVVPHLTAPPLIATAAYSFNPVCGPSMLVKRADLAAIGYPEQDLAEDYELVCRVLRSGGLIANLSEPLYDYRWHDNTSRQRREELDAAYAAVRDRHWRKAPPSSAWSALPWVRRRRDLSAVAQLALRQRRAS